MKRLMLYTLTYLLALSVPAFAYVGDAYVTPDSWSKHVNANGIKASLNGLNFGEAGILKIGHCAATYTWMAVISSSHIYVHIH